MPSACCYCLLFLLLLLLLLLILAVCFLLLSCALQYLATACPQLSSLRIVGTGYDAAPLLAPLTQLQHLSHISIKITE